MHSPLPHAIKPTRIKMVGIKMRVNEQGTEFKDKNVSVAIVERTAGSLLHAARRFFFFFFLFFWLEDALRIRALREGRSRYLYKRKRRFHGHYSPAPSFFYGLPVLGPRWAPSLGFIDSYPWIFPSEPTRDVTRWCHQRKPPPLHLLRDVLF